jgi:luciferase family oxidoreductase group 1
MRLSIVDQSPVPAGFTPADALLNSIELARYAERLGYSRYWVAEHHATPAFAGSAPEVLIGRIAAETNRIRVGSGAVLLPHYSPLKVVESFRVLHALYPDRIDLGIGRAPGGNALDAYALQRHHSVQERPDDFPMQLAELLAFLHGGFPAEHAFSRIKVSPAMPGAPELWLLGSSGWSADAAAQLGLPYAAAHFINPETTRASIEHYYESFQPSPYLEAPLALVATGAICAETDAEAEHLAASQRLRRILRDRGENESGPIPTPEEALARYGGGRIPAPSDESEWPRVFVGSIERVQEELEGMTRELKLEELMVITVVHDHEARKRSYALLAEAFGLKAEGQLSGK